MVKIPTTMETEKAITWNQNITVVWTVGST